MMLDITARDLAARRASWGTPQGEVPLPAVMHVHTGTRPAPAEAALAIGHEEAEHAVTLRFGGSVFEPEPEDQEGLPFALPRALVYPGSVDAALHRAADERNPDGPVRIAHRVEDLEPHAGLLVLPTARRVAGDPWKLASFLVTARRNAGPNAVLYTPGIGRPDEIALAAYAGVDVLDGLVPVLEGLAERYLTPEGPLEAGSLSEPMCACGGCRSAQDGEGLDRDGLVAHNRWAAEAEVRRVRHAIEQGSLRELVEARAKAKPEHVATLRRYDLDHAGFFEQQAASVRTRELPILGPRSLTRPEIRRWLDRLEQRYAPPPSANVLVALPCAATKPYQNSPTHRAIRPAIEQDGHGRAHVVTLTSPLGAVPEELELNYPAAHYDVPVTGDWNADEQELIQRAYRAVWKAGDYEHAILHLPPEEAEIVEPVLPRAERTVARGERATDDAATDRLADAVRQAVAGLDATARTDLFEEHMARRIDWQFGPGVADVLAEGTEIRGRYPYLKLMHGDTQLAMLKPERGALTLTFEGGERIHEATDAYTLWIDDFHPKGDVFAPGVLDAAETIRVADEVLIVHEDELRAVGRANAPGPEMAAMQHGSCAEVRHHA